MPVILLLSGPNLNLFGQRDPAVYGTDTLDDMVGDARKAAAEHGYDLDHVQSNHEGEIVDAIHDARNRCDAIVINPGAFGHYSYAIADALQTYEGVKIELHVSNTAAREEWRHHSVISAYVTGTIIGLGRTGYRLAIAGAVAKLKLELSGGEAGIPPSSEAGPERPGSEAAESGKLGADS